MRNHRKGSVLVAVIVGVAVILAATILYHGNIQKTANKIAQETAQAAAARDQETKAAAEKTEADRRQQAADRAAEQARRDEADRKAAEKANRAKNIKADLALLDGPDPHALMEALSHLSSYPREEVFDVLFAAMDSRDPVEQDRAAWQAATIGSEFLRSSFAQVANFTGYNISLRNAARQTVERMSPGQARTLGEANARAIAENRTAIKANQTAIAGHASAIADLDLRLQGVNCALKELRQEAEIATAAAKAADQRVSDLSCRVKAAEANLAKVAIEAQQLSRSAAKASDVAELRKSIASHKTRLEQAETGLAQLRQRVEAAACEAKSAKSAADCAQTTFTTAKSTPVERWVCQPRGKCNVWVPQ